MTRTSSMSNGFRRSNNKKSKCLIQRLRAKQKKKLEPICKPQKNAPKNSDERSNNDLKTKLDLLEVASASNSENDDLKSCFSADTDKYGTNSYPPSLSSLNDLDLDLEKLGRRLSSKQSLNDSDNSSDFHSIKSIPIEQSRPKKLLNELRKDNSNKSVSFDDSLDNTYEYNPISMPKSVKTDSLLKRKCSTKSTDNNKKEADNSENDLAFKPPSSYKALSLFDKTVKPRLNKCKDRKENNEDLAVEDKESLMSSDNDDSCVSADDEEPPTQVKNENPVCLKKLSVQCEKVEPVSSKNEEFENEETKSVSVRNNEIKEKRQNKVYGAIEIRKKIFVKITEFLTNLKDYFASFLPPFQLNFEMFIILIILLTALGLYLYFGGIRLDESFNIKKKVLSFHKKSQKEICINPNQVPADGTCQRKDLGSIKPSMNVLEVVSCMRKKFQNQDCRLWEIIKYSYNDHKASIINPGPGILLLAADETGFDTAQCLAKKIGDSFSSECSQNSLTFLLDCRLYQWTQPDVALKQISHLVKNKISEGTRTIIFSRLDALPAFATTMFMDIFTTTNPNFKQSYFIFTVQVDPGDWNVNAGDLKCIRPILWNKLIRQYLSYILHSRDPFTMNLKLVEKLVAYITPFNGWVKKETSINHSDNLATICT